MQKNSEIQDFDSKRNLLSLCLASFVIVTGFSVIIPFFPIYANDLLIEFDVLGFTFGIALQIGIVTAASKFVQIFLTPAYGELSDTVGRKPLILIGMTVYTVLMVGYGFAYDFLTLFLLRALSGIGSASVWTIGEALVVDGSPEEKRGKNLGLYMFSMLLGVTTGPFLGYGLFTLFTSIGFVEMTSYRLTFIGVGIFGVIATFMVLFMVKDPKLRHYASVFDLYRTSIKAMVSKTIQSPVILLKTLSSDDGYRNRSIYTIYLVALVNGIGLALLLPIGALFFEDYYNIDPGNIALILGVIGLLSLVGTPFGGVMSDKIGRKLTVWTTGVLGGSLMFFLGFRSGILFIIIIFTARRFLFSILSPAFRALQSDLVPEEVRGKEFGVVQAANNLGSVIGPILGGWLYDLYFGYSFDVGEFEFIGVGITFAFSGILAILASILLLILVNPKDTIQLDKRVEIDSQPQF